MAPWSIFTTFVALIAVVSCHPQYSGPPTDQVAQGSGVHSGAAISSSCYSSSYDCVPYFQCIDGVINTDGAGLIDLRIKPAATCINPEYPDVPAVCCLIPGGVATPSPLDTCPGLNECVNPNQCSANGYIITDGSGLIDIRAGQTTCWNGQAVGVCCTPPLPVLDTCPGHSYCSAKGCAGSALDGSNSWNPYTQGVGVWQQCALEFGNTGVCCDPPALNACPHDSACVVDGQCVGTALDPFDAFVNYGPNAGFFMKCNVGGISGVCCKQPILNECPIHSACVAHGTCLGEALDYQNSWINYIQTGSWRECGVGATSGICCKQPVLDVCPGGGVCVDHASCLGQGLNHLDSWIDYSTQGATWQQCGLGGSNGVCCKQPVKVLDYCPSGSVCTDQGNCATSALNYDNQFVSYATGGKYQECALSAGYNGICCQANQLIDRCPDSHCVEYGKCTGTAMNLNGQFVDYDPIGSWSECNLGAGYSNPAGVCCIAKQTHLHPADKCGIRNYDIDQRIQSNPYADNEAAFGEFPWQAIIFFQNYTFKCGATLISNKHAITAAHCVDKGMTADQIRLRFGEWQVNSFDEPLPYEDRNVYGIYIHPAYNPRNVHNDIAVLELVEPIPLNYHINSVCMPPYGYTFAPGTRCFTSGWGKDSFEGNFQHILKKIDVPFVEHSYCQELMRKTRLGKWFRLDKSFMCAGGEANKDACYGDGGGPLVCKDPATQQYLLAGITSWGIGCGTQDVPGIYVDVGKFSQWVDEIVLGSPVKAEQNTAPLGYGK